MKEIINEIKGLVHSSSVDLGTYGLLELKLRDVEEKYLESIKRTEKLWTLLDDIDTASDMFKPSKTNGINSYNNFYEYSMGKVEQRHKVLKSLDGQTLKVSNSSIQSKISPICIHEFTQKDYYWISCIHCGKLKPL